MKRLISFIIVLSFILVSINTYAFDWKSLNAELLNQTENDSQTIAALKDRQNRTFKVIYQDETMLAKLTGEIVKFKNEFYSWRGIRFKDISFMVFDNRLVIVIIPLEIMHNNHNLATAIPAGITMTFDPEKNVTRYDFRIMREDQFIRINGDYSDEDELAVKIGLAYDNPWAYLQPAGTGTTVQETGHSDDNDRIRQALIYLYNEDWNGRRKAVPPEIIQRVVALRQSNPGLNKKQLWKVIRKERVKVSEREFDLILIFYFNEFE